MVISGSVPDSGRELEVRDPTGFQKGDVVIDLIARSPLKPGKEKDVRSSLGLRRPRNLSISPYVSFRDLAVRRSGPRGPRGPEFLAVRIPTHYNRAPRP
jgi:hypothetical protein